MKKMVYLYVCTYAATHPELSLLAINTLQKDCRDQDPMTRGLALRSFTGLRLANIVEYLPKVISDGLRDENPYVRKTAVMGCVKLHLLSPEHVTEYDIVNTLYNMLRDRDAQHVVQRVDHVVDHERLRLQSVQLDARHHRRLAHVRAGVLEASDDDRGQVLGDVLEPQRCE